MDQHFRTTRLSCPNCQTPLVEVERAEVLIDACPSCRGVWLDRGELDKVLDKERRSLAGVDDPARDFVAEMRGERPPAVQPRPPVAPSHQAPQGYDHGHGSHKPKRKRKGMFSELFEEMFD